MIDRKLLRATRGLRKKGPFQRGVLGNAAGDIRVAGRPGYFHVRVERPGGYEEGIFPGRVPPYLNLPVRIETHPITKIQYIAGVDDHTMAYGGTDPADVPDVDPHAETHEWGGSDMLMWLHTTQLFPLRCQAHATDGQSVTIQGGTYFAEGAFCAQTTTQDVDLAAYYPAGGRKYVLIYLDASGTAHVQDDGASTLTSIQPAPPGMFWVAAVRLVTGDTIGWQDIVDLRFLNAGVIGGGEIELGADYIILGDGYPDITGEWMRIGTQGANWDGCRAVDAEVYGSTTVHAENGVGLLLEDVAGVVARALLIWGGYHEVPLVIRRCDGTTGHLDIATIDWDGDIALLAGSLTLPAGETVDTVDISAHVHDGSAGDAPALPFLNLSDTPTAYTGMAGKVATVNDTEDALLFEEAGGSSGGGDTTALTFQAKYWTIDGPLAVADEIGGVWRVAQNFIISTITMYLMNTGDLGDTTIDVERSDDGGQTWTSLFPTAPKPSLPGGQLDRRASSVPDTTLVFQNDLLRVNIDDVATGDSDYDARGLSVQIDGEIHQMEPTLYKVTLTTADTEYEQTLPAGVRAISFRERTGSIAIRYAWETGKVATPTDPYYSLLAGESYWKENLVAASVTLYLASGTAGAEVEIEVWS